MSYIKKFESPTDYQSFIGGDGQTQRIIRERDQ